MIRRLNELQINTIIKCVNSDTLDYISVYHKKPYHGYFYVEYKTSKNAISGVRMSAKDGIKEKLINALLEINLNMKQHKIKDVSLIYNRKDDSFNYYLIQTTVE